MATVSPPAASTEPLEPEAGITTVDRKALADALATVLAESYTLLGKTHGYHWNVTGPQFPALHTLFETQYQNLAEAVDEIAERIRALGHFAPGGLGAFRALSEIEDEGDVPDAATMLARLARDHDLLARHCRAVVDLCGEADDSASEDLMNARLAFHEKSSWMLRASLEA